ncbi:molybdenum cofactor guanylyltransferase MobA [Allorhizobium undicola]|uniref:molybdenum cofactor guanylyltransferase MobA n=1 Tax=Allorhizobium undicola TaxID=78527 RepID=UPI000483759F|nr:molybdenum cofactor guanylyltransferase MobA [Allorhizobium undicola]
MSGPPFPAVVLAGGLSRRMGANKAEVLLAGKPLLAHVLARLGPQAEEIAINSNDPCDSMGYARIADPLPDRPGPLAGIAAAMTFAETRASHVLTVPVDSPFIPKDLGRRLGAALETLHAAAATGHAPAPHQAIAIASSSNRLHPVIAFWPTSLRHELVSWLAEGKSRKVMDFLEGRSIVTVEFPPFETPSGSFDPFFNVNTPQDLAAAEAFLATGS